MRTARHEPTFFWQGMMIVFPALVLAGAGLVSLRQDRVLAEHEARQEAERLAAGLAEALAAQAEVVPRSVKTVAGGAEAWDSVQAEPLWAAFQQGTFLRISESNQVLYPPSPEPLAFHVLHEDELPVDAWAAWTLAREALFLDGDLERANQAFAEFLNQGPPEGHAAVAKYQRGLVLVQLGAGEAARSLFESITREHPMALGETGLPLKPMSELQLAVLFYERGEKAAARQWFNRCHASLMQSGYEGGAVVGKNAGAWGKLAGEPFAGDVAEWKKAREEQELSRRFWTETGAADEMKLGWHAWEGNDYWTHRVSREGLESWKAMERSAVEALARGIVRERQVPEHFGVSVVWDGIELANTELAGKRMAEASGVASEADLVRVALTLEQPEVIYARQRARSIWFGALVTFATAAVLGGFFAARNAFQKQKRLNALKSGFVSSVSHEMRAPIASVRLMAEELMDAGLPDRQKTKEYHRFIVQECRRLSGLIENVLDFARHEQGRKRYHFEHGDLAELARETVDMMQLYAAEKGIAVRLTENGEAEAVLDRDSIRQALVNLIDNAIKHSPPGSEVRVGVEPAGANRIRLWVEDNGPGVPLEDQSKIFDAFYRRGTELRRETQGVGLGLSIVKRVAEAHSGQAWIESEPGRGSRFIIELRTELEEHGKNTCR